MKAVTVAVVQARSGKVEPVRLMDSPSAWMMNQSERSAKWPPSTYQSAPDDAPYFGIQNRTAGETYSMPSATAQSTSRACPPAKPPAIQKIADTASQTRMRTAFMRAKVRAGGVDSRKKMARPTCIPAYATANHTPRDSKAFGID